MALSADQQLITEIEQAYCRACTPIRGEALPMDMTASLVQCLNRLEQCYLDELVAPLATGQLGSNGLALAPLLAGYLRDASCAVGWCSPWGEILSGVLSFESGIALQQFQNGRLEQEDWERLHQAVSDLLEWPLFQLCTPRPTPMQLHELVRELAGCSAPRRLLVVDGIETWQGIWAAATGAGDGAATAYLQALAAHYGCELLMTH